MNLLNKLFKKKEKTTCVEDLKEFLDDELSLYPKIVDKLVRRTEQVRNDSIDWICEDLKHCDKIKKIIRSTPSFN